VRVLRISPSPLTRPGFSTNLTNLTEQPPPALGLLGFLADSLFEIPNNPEI
jgi:hypothetical protein